jgi:hypothetical protein
MIKTITNAAIFQVGWFLSVVYGNVIAAIVFTIAVVVYGVFYLRARSEIVLIATIIALGYAGDTLLGSFGVLLYPSGMVFPPFWMVTLWLLFAMALPWSLRWIVERKYWFVLFSAIGGPISYVIGVNLSAVQFGSDSTLVIALVALLWLVHGLSIHSLFSRWQQSRNSL